MTDSNVDKTPPSGIPVVAAPSEPFEAPLTPTTGSGTMRPVRVETQGSGCGCVLPAFITLFITAALVVVALFLPPFNLMTRLLGDQYTMLDATGNGVQFEGMTLLVDPEQLDGEFGVQLASVPVSDFVTGGSDSWIAASQAAIPPYLALQSAVYRVETTGQAPDTVNVTVNVPTNVGGSDLLDLYAWDEETSAWTFVPSRVDGSTVTATLEQVPDGIALFQASPLEQPTVLVSVDVESLTSAVAQLSTIVAPAGMQPTLEGTLVGSLAAGFDQNAAYRVMPIVRNFYDSRAIDPDTVIALIGNSQLRAEHIRQITALAANGGFEGVFIDYRDLPAEQRENFALFITELGENLDRANLLLGVVVPQAENVGGTWETGAYDWRAIGMASDYVQINLTNNPTSYQPGETEFIEAMLRWAVGEVSRYKLLIGLSALSVREVAGVYTTVGYDQALAALGDVEVEASDVSEIGSIEPGAEITASLDGFDAVSGMDTTIQAPFIDYIDDDGTPVSRMWLTTGDALRYRMDRTIPFALGGVALGDLLYDGVADGVLQAVLEYKLQLPASFETTELALRWRIEGTNGLIAEVTTGLNEDLVATVTAPDGNYAVNVAVVAEEAESARSGAAVALFAPTATPTPLPTSTPTPTPTPTFTPAPIIATAPPAAVAPSVPSGNTGGVVGPIAGSITVGNFEYGGQVTSAGSQTAISAMRRAGMSWMKVQIRYSPGADPGIAAGPINEAHANGFKILLSVLGSPGELAAGGGGYLSGFASFLGGVAALGPDAIEVWNEANIDREWPNGQISGAGYTDMLRQAYQSIKGANGNVLVISAAPAPTGAEAAYPGAVVNDDNWIRQMVGAGGLNYMDCLGVHYNEGIVGPDQRTGDPRDGYYTRYFGGMLDTYWGLIGGAKPLCFTEIGYLTPEGYPPLPGYFAWGQNTTVAQQASWLARAAALSSQSGRVRLMIIFNVDFTVYGSDPQAGFAIIRPGGGCPACDALAASR